MSVMMPEGSELDYSYQAGGSLPINSPTYVDRQADRDLYQALLQGQYCYVLNARQMGKSSLRIQTMNRLQTAGITCAEIELSGIGSNDMTPQQWYGGIIQEIASGFSLRFKRRQWFQDHSDLSPVQRLGTFIETVLLTQITEPIVVFIDEIDSVLKLDFSVDDFFALLRNCYEKRSTRPEFSRLTFVLLGVAQPSDLIQDPKSTPFNIGTRIRLTGFQLPDCRPLAAGLVGYAEDPDALLEAILSWTGGQPFLTQKVCWLVVRAGTYVSSGQESKWITTLVETQILQQWETQDQPEHLRTIRDRLIRSPIALTLLKLYRRMLKHGSLPSRPHSPHLELQLTGLVAQEQGRLVIKNRLYAALFNLNWVTDQLRDLNSTEREIPLWGVGLVSALVTGGVGVVRLLGLLQPYELQAYDQLMRALPTEPLDERILMIEITDEDRQRYGSTFDSSLNQALDRLRHYQPRVIGLALWPLNPDVTLSPRPSDPVLVSLCPNVGLLDSDELRAKGFAQIETDIPLQPYRYVVRRHLLKQTDVSGSLCSSYSFDFQIANQYRQFPLDLTQQSWGTTKLPQLQTRSSGYQTLATQGYELLVRYRNTPDPNAVTRRLSLQEVLTSDPVVDLSWIEDHIVLVGLGRDPVHEIPLGRIQPLSLHAHVISALITATSDPGRPLVWWWPWWGEGLWIGSFSLITGSVIWATRSTIYQCLGILVVVGLVYGSCWVGFLYSIWLPLIPSLLSVGGAAVALASWEVVVREHRE